jgi:hypothetical protein
LAERQGEGVDGTADALFGFVSSAGGGGDGGDLEGLFE